MEERGMIQGTPHKVSLNGRRHAAVTGVSDVLAFDLNEVLLETTQGMLMLKGNDLHVKRLSLEKGEVDVEGNIDSILYSEPTGLNKQPESFLGRLFR